MPTVSGDRISVNEMLARAIVSCYTWGVIMRAMILTMCLFCVSALLGTGCGPVDPVPQSQDRKPAWYWYKFEEGESAHRRGLAFGDNPFNGFPGYFAAWQDGWRYAQSQSPPAKSE